MIEMGIISERDKGGFTLDSDEMRWGSTVNLCASQLCVWFIWSWSNFVAVASEEDHAGIW